MTEGQWHLGCMKGWEIPAPTTLRRLVELTISVRGARFGIVSCVGSTICVKNAQNVEAKSSSARYLCARGTILLYF